MIIRFPMCKVTKSYQNRQMAEYHNTGINTTALPTLSYNNLWLQIRTLTMAAM